jgi:hypothetical protein
MALPLAGVPVLTCFAFFPYLRLKSSDRCDHFSFSYFYFLRLMLNRS